MKKSDLILILALVAIGAAAIVIMQPRGDAAMAELYVAGESIWSCPLDSAGEYRAGNVLVEVAGGRARIAHSDCRDQTCVNMGWISRAGQSVVCLPNKLSVVLTGEDALDAVLE
ncbi:MAG: NusG domain II-containing protein [Christensenellales bacterium]|jgi:hypothetical protein